MPSKSNKTNQISKEIIDISKLNINDRISGGAKKKNKEPESDYESDSETESSEIESSDESNVDEQVSSDDERDIDEEQDEEQDENEEEEETEETETEETDKETDVDEKTNRESDNESKVDEEDNEEDNTKDKCYQKFSKKSIVDTDIDYDEYFIKDDEIIINKTGRLTKPYLTKYEKVRILGDRARQLAQGAKPMIKNTTGLSHKEVALLELKNKVIPLIIERPIPNVGVEKWKLTELEINL